jgi:hypothetical protein
VTIAAQAVGEEPARARTHASLPAGPAWKTARQPRHTSFVPAGPSAGRLPAGYRALVAASRAVCTTVSTGGPLELVATITGIVPARMPKKI